MKSEVTLVTMVPTEDELEFMGEVGVEMFDGKVVSQEVSVALMVAAALESRDVLRR